MENVGTYVIYCLFHVVLNVCRSVSIVIVPTAGDITDVREKRNSDPRVFNRLLGRYPQRPHAAYKEDEGLERSRVDTAHPRDIEQH